MEQSINQLNNQDGDNCIAFDLLFRYIEHEATPLEIKTVEKHLNTCDICRETVAQMIRLEKNPITDEEMKQAVSLLKMSPEEQVAKIMKFVADDKSRDEGETQTYPKPIPIPNGEKTEDTTHEQNGKTIWKRYWPAAAVLLLVAIWFGSQPLLTNMEIERDYKSAWASLQDSLTYNIFADAQFSTDYQFRTTDKMMSMDTIPELTFLDRAEIHLQNVLKNDPEHPEARQKLAEIYIEEKNFAKADSLLKEIQKTAGNSAEVLNNYGVFYFKQQKWQKAAEYFQQAIDTTPDFIKAIYSLGLAKIELGEKEEAVSAFTRYIEVEADEGRRSAAQRLIQEINQSGEDVP